ncbi:MAG TPA: hypothetical protein DD423_06350 [Opitutae bacterium]|nr:hypothetical protein [Opitutae bacterium]
MCEPWTQASDEVVSELVVVPDQLITTAVSGDAVTRAIDVREKIRFVMIESSWHMKWRARQI